MLCLGIDTTSAHGQIALASESSYQSKHWGRDQSHSEVATSFLQELLTEQNVKIQDITHLCTFNGPGSFTGIRVGLSIIQSISYSLNLPVLIKDSLWGLAKNFKAPPNQEVNQQGEHILCMNNAQRNKVFAALYLNTTTSFTTLIEPQLLGTLELEKLLPKNFHVFGDAYEIYKAGFSRKFEKQILSLNSENKTNLQALCSQLSSIPVTQLIKWSDVHPYYLRASTAEEIRLGLK